MTRLEKLELRIGNRNPTEQDIALLTYMLELAEEDFLSFTNRQTVPEKAENLIVEMAYSKFRSNDSFGEVSRSEGAISVTFESGKAYPAETMAGLTRFRLLKAVHAGEGGEDGSDDQMEADI